MTKRIALIAALTALAAPASAHARLLGRRALRGHRAAGRHAERGHGPALHLRRPGAQRPARPRRPQLRQRLGLRLRRTGRPDAARQPRLGRRRQRRRRQRRALRRRAERDGPPARPARQRRLRDRRQRLHAGRGRRRLGHRHPRLRRRAPRRSTSAPGPDSVFAADLSGDAGRAGQRVDRRRRRRRRAGALGPALGGHGRRRHGLAGQRRPRPRPGGAGHDRPGGLRPPAAADHRLRPHGRPVQPRAPTRSTRCATGSCTPTRTRRGARRRGARPARPGRHRPRRARARRA